MLFFSGHSGSSARKICVLMSALRQRAASPFCFFIKKDSGFKLDGVREGQRGKPFTCWVLFGTESINWPRGVDISNPKSTSLPPSQSLSCAFSASQLLPCIFITAGTMAARTDADTSSSQTIPGAKVNITPCTGHDWQPVYPTASQSRSKEGAHTKFCTHTGSSAPIENLEWDIASSDGSSIDVIHHRCTVFLQTITLTARRYFARDYMLPSVLLDKVQTDREDGTDKCLRRYVGSDANFW